jgi:PST family polysaccharide transporter
MLAFGGNLTAFNVVNYFTGNFDNILIGRVLGSAPLGIYSKAYGLLSLPISQINIPMASVMLPGLSRLQQSPSEYARLFVNAVRAIGLVTVPIVVFSFFLAHDIVLVLLSRKWMAVAPVFQLIAPAALFSAVSFAPGWLCQSLGRPRRQLHYALVSAPIAVTGFLIGINWGIRGVAVSYSVTFSVCFWGYVWYATKSSPVRFVQIAIAFLGALVPSLLAGGIVWLMRRWFVSQVTPLLALMSMGGVFAIIYVSIAALTADNRRLFLSGVGYIKQVVKRA